VVIDRFVTIEPQNGNDPTEQEQDDAEPSDESSEREEISRSVKNAPHAGLGDCLSHAGVQ
jgi:hypothetical protein